MYVSFVQVELNQQHTMSHHPIEELKLQPKKEHDVWMIPEKEWILSVNLIDPILDE